MCMELFVGLKGGYKVACSACLKKVNIGDAKVKDGKAYCKTCYNVINKN